MTLTVFTVLWATAFWPALHTPWYYLDDYGLARYMSPDQALAERGLVNPDAPVDVPRCVSLGLGRPMLYLWWFTFALDRDPSWPWVNIGLRWFQGCTHVVTAALIAYLLWKPSRSYWAVPAVLPFVLWCFNPEVVLWRGAGINVFAVFFSVLGLLCIKTEGRRWQGGWWVTGLALVALSMLTTQGAAMGGLVTWVILVALETACGQGSPGRHLRHGAFLLGGYLVGGLLSLAVLKYSAEPNPRATLPPDLHSRVLFLLGHNKLFLFWPGAYPRVLKYAHAALCLLTPLVVLASGTRLTRQGVVLRWRAPVLLACLASCLVLPYLSLLLVNESWITVRNLYTAPLLLTALVAVGVRLCGRRLWLQAAYAAVLLCILVPYVRMARTHAAEFVRTHRNDLRGLRELEQFAAARGTGKVLLLYCDFPARDWNPYHLNYIGHDLHISAWHVPANPGLDFFVIRHSRLQVVEDDGLKARALKRCREVPPPAGLFFFLIEGSDVIAVCSP
jgi:hypothetical protein